MRRQAYFKHHEEVQLRELYQAAVESEISNMIKRTLKKHERETVASKLNNLDLDEIKKNEEELIADFIYRFTPHDEDIDIQEQLNSMIGINSEDTARNFNQHMLPERLNGLNPEIIEKKKKSPGNVHTFMEVRDIWDFVQQLNPSAHKASSYLELDSRFRKLHNDGTTEISFGTQLDGDSKSQGAVSYKGVVKNISGLKFTKISIPEPTNYVTGTTGWYEEFTMLIKEFSGSAIVTQDQSTMFHMKFGIEEHTTKNRLILTPLFSDGVVYLPGVQPELQQITLSFAMPYTPAIFPRDRAFAAMTMANPTVVTCPYAHNLQNNDIVNFNTDTPFSTATPLALTDSPVIAAINAIGGVVVTVTGANTFTIPIDSSTVVGAPNTPRCYFSAHRIFFTIQLMNSSPKPMNQI